MQSLQPRSQQDEKTIDVHTNVNVLMLIEVAQVFSTGLVACSHSHVSDSPNPCYVALLSFPQVSLEYILSRPSASNLDNEILAAAVQTSLSLTKPTANNLKVRFRVNSLFLSFPLFFGDMLNANVKLRVPEHDTFRCTKLCDFLTSQG